MTNSVSTRKPTKRDRYNELLAIPAVAENVELVEFINHELELLTRKNTTKDGEKKLSKEQLANVAVGEEILSYMEIDHLYSISDLIKLVPSCVDLSVPKVSAIVRPMREKGLVVKIEDKRKVFYKLA